ncbi:unnamed protein product [Alternaria alternata]
MRDAERSEEVLCSQIDDGVRMHLYLSTTVVVRFDAIREGATATAESLVIWYMEKRGDGAQPRCHGCQVRGQECRWGLKVTFHPSRSLELSSKHCAALLAIERKRGQPDKQADSIQIVNDTDQIVHEYQDCSATAFLESERTRAAAPRSEDTIAEYANSRWNPTISTVWDLNFPMNSSVASQTQAFADSGGVAFPSSTWNDRTYQENASSSSTSTCSTLPHRAVTGVVPLETDTVPVSQAEQSRLLSAYLQETGAWCEATDSSRHFTVSYVHKLIENQPFAGAAMALASRQLDALRNDKHVSAAFVLKEQTLVPTDDWIDDCNAWSIAATLNTDAYCNLATLIFAKITNMIAKYHNNCQSDVQELWSELQDWRQYRPTQVLPLIRTEAHQRSPFPIVVHTDSSSVCGNTFYHAGAILLLQTKHVCCDEAETGADVHNTIWHARELCGISTTNASHSSWVNQVQLLYIAGQAFGCGSGMQQNVSRLPDESDGADVCYAAEKLAILKHLAKIERETGWKTSNRAADLRRLWELE